MQPFAVPKGDNVETTPKFISLLAFAVGVALILFSSMYGLALYGVGMRPFFKDLLGVFAGLLPTVTGILGYALAHFGQSQLEEKK